MQSAQLVNYLGKVDSVEKVEVEPLVLRKGSSQLALYGLGNIRDERLHRALQSENVRSLPIRDAGIIQGLSGVV